MGSVVRIPEKSHAPDRRDELLQKPYPFGGDVWAEDGIACEFPPGCARLVTSPALTGSPTEIMTIGIDVVACLAAKLAAVP
jgi:hypothetical protein